MGLILLCLKGMMVPALFICDATFQETKMQHHWQVEGEVYAISSKRGLWSTLWRWLPLSIGCMGIFEWLSSWE